MTLLTAWRLVFLIGVAILAVAYLVLQRRRRTYALRFASSELFDSIAPSSPGLRRHAPATAFLLALSVLVVAFAQPARQVRVPRERATVIVAIDVSLSMQAGDVDVRRIRLEHGAMDAFDPKRWEASHRFARSDLDDGRCRGRITCERGVDDAVLVDGGHHQQRSGPQQGSVDEVARRHSQERETRRCQRPDRPRSVVLDQLGRRAARGVVRQVRLGLDQDDLRSACGVEQGPRSADAGDAATDHDDPFAGHVRDSSPLDQHRDSWPACSPASCPNMCVTPRR